MKEEHQQEKNRLGVIARLACNEVAEEANRTAILYRTSIVVEQDGETVK
jgi:hypothetical protein